MRSRWEAGQYSRTSHIFDAVTRQARPGRRTVVPVEAASRRGVQSSTRPEMSRDSEAAHGQLKRV